MQRKKFFYLLPLACYLFSFYNLNARDVPNLRARVTDETWTISESFQRQLESKLTDFEKASTNQIAILIISSLDAESIEEFSLKVAEKNKLGQKNTDNGVLLLIVKDDRKLRIEVGYGLEGVLTDVLCHRIIESEIKPHFKAGDFETGITAGIDSIIGAIGGTYFIPPPKDYSYLGPLSFFGALDGGGENIPIVVRIFASLFVVFVLGIFTYVAATTPYIGWFIYFFLFPFWSLFPIALHGVNIGVSIFLIYVIGIGLYKLYFLLTPSGRKKMEERESFVSGGSSSGSSSGWSSGGSSGGFSGGGGSFGGGGSSGSW
ncbi:MAG: TPM domain-containing protein [Leptospira sp.]|nr:TPM domain-containing protein [Leptospira sp.]